MKKNLLLFLIMFLASVASAQTGEKYTVQGVVADTTGVAEEFATVRIFAATDTVKPVATLITGENGDFIQPLAKPTPEHAKMQKVWA